MVWPLLRTAQSKRHMQFKKRDLCALPVLKSLSAEEQEFLDPSLEVLTEIQNHKPDANRTVFGPELGHVPAALDPIPGPKTDKILVSGTSTSCTGNMGIHQH